MKILVTGATGYIGSHTCVELLNSGYEVAGVDDLSNSDICVVDRIRKITGRDMSFYTLNILDRPALSEVFEKERPEAVIHFAGFKAVAESVLKPLEYYHNNITGTLILCDVMREHGVKNIVFSSSATVYGEAEKVPVTEDTPQGRLLNPYGRTKAYLEQILTDLHISDNEWNVMLLRYFNPIGAHESGTIGEDPKGIPNNLLPYITQVAVGRRDHLNIFGNDYATPDGTCIRDYIHVSDLADGHVKALKKMTGSSPEVRIYNLGTGTGYSVLDVVNAFMDATGINIPYVIADRRPGDAPEIYADPSRTERELGWKAVRDLKKMCADAWNWQHNNPEGYRS